MHLKTVWVLISLKIHIFQGVTTWFRYKKCISRTGNELIVEPNAFRYSPCEAREIKVHKSAVKDNLGPHFVKNPYFSGCLPPGLGLKIAFYEPEMS